jgi:UMF1 family MFS transporter
MASTEPGSTRIESKRETDSIVSRFNTTSRDVFRPHRFKAILTAMTDRAPRHERISWALYDFANTVFSMNMMTLFFVAWIVEDFKRSNTLFATVNGIASIMVVISIPFFGAISDATQRRKPWVVAFTIISCAATVLVAAIGQHSLPLVGEGVVGTNSVPPLSSSLTMPLVIVLIAFIVANYTYQGAQPFYNAMLPDLVPQNEQGRLSGLAASFGYVGAIVAVLVAFPFFQGSLPLIGNVPTAILGALRSLPYAGVGGRVSTFVPTAVLFLGFSLPLFFFCRDHHATRDKKTIPWRKAFQDLKGTLAETKRYPGSLRFILTSFIYQDAMGTIVTSMALYAIFAMDFEKGAEANVFLIMTLPAVIGSYLIGKLVDRIGAKKTLSLVLLCWVILLSAMIAIPSRAAFWLIGLLIGFIYGGVSTAERPLLLTLIPAEEAGRFFSLMVLSSRAAAIAGPLIFAVTVDSLLPGAGAHAAYRAGVATIAVAMLIALLMLQKVPDKRRA